MLVGRLHTTAVLELVSVRFSGKPPAPLDTLNVTLVLLALAHATAVRGAETVTLMSAADVMGMDVLGALPQSELPREANAFRLAPTANQPAAGRWQVTTNVVLVGTVCLHT